MVNCPRRPNRSWAGNGRTANASYSPVARWLLALIAATLFGTVGAIAAWPQSSTTSLRGTVTDSLAAVVAGAEVVLADSSVAFSRTLKTDDRGAYQFLQVPPGTYTISVAAAGFTNSRKENVVLQVNTPATLNFVLRVGAATTTIDVQGEAPVVNTVDASLGNPFDAKQILEIPSEGRNAVELLSLQAGVTYVGNQVDAAADSRGGSVNGARSDQTNITVDGLDNNDQLLGDAFTGVLRIPMDSLEEFRVVTTNSNADSGRSSGAQVSLVTKSGTNQFHGTAYEYNRTSLGTANDWFNKKAELQSGLPNKPGPLIRNTFGGALGGPHHQEPPVLLCQLRGPAIQRGRSDHPVRSQRKSASGNCELCLQPQSRCQVCFGNAGYYVLFLCLCSCWRFAGDHATGGHSGHRSGLPLQRHVPEWKWCEPGNFESVGRRNNPSRRLSDSGIPCFQHGFLRQRRWI